MKRKVRIMMNIVLFGAPGCGKGTQAQRLKTHYGIEHVSTGAVIRSEIRRGTELGRSMEHYISTGRLAPDEVVIGMIANYVAEHKNAKGCIFDGFPRTTVQARAFDQILAQHGLIVDIMIDIQVPEEELIRRILLRGKDSGRADGSPSTSGRPPSYRISTRRRRNMRRSTVRARWTRCSDASPRSSTPSEICIRRLLRLAPAGGSGHSDNKSSVHSKALFVRYLQRRTENYAKFRAYE